MAVHTYAPDQVTVVFGPVVLEGFAPDSLVAVEYEEDLWTKQVGADGHVARSKTNNATARVTVRLMQTSMSNDMLSAIAQLDRHANEGVFPLMIKDNSGRSLHVAESAWITRPPNSEYAREAGTREWAFDTGQLESFVGGN